jgi:hypothetical protein
LFSCPKPAPEVGGKVDLCEVVDHMSNRYKTIAFWLAICLILFALLLFKEEKKEGPEKITYAEFLEFARTADISNVTLQAKESTGIESGVTIRGERTVDAAEGGTKSVEFETFTTDVGIHEVLQEQGIPYSEKAYES